MILSATQRAMETSSFFQGEDRLNSLALNIHLDICNTALSWMEEDVFWIYKYYYQSVLFVAFIDKQSGALIIPDFDVAVPALQLKPSSSDGNIPDMGGIYCLFIALWPLIMP